MSNRLAPGYRSCSPVSPYSWLWRANFKMEVQIDSPGDRLRLVLVLSLGVLIAHAFVPIEQFIQRGDDAYYYLKVAHDFPRLGFWSFDGENPTSGVQPLWAVLLSGFSQFLHLVGWRDPDLFARAAVALAGVIHFASGMLLYRVVARAVSPVAGLAAAGALLFPAGLVWGRIWGMENSLYALLLTGSVAYYQSAFARRRDFAGAAVLGLLVGLTALARLNASLLAPCLLLHLLFSRHIDQSFWRRFRLGAVTGSVVLALLLGFVGIHQRATGSWLPVSGAVKAFYTRQFLDRHEIESRFSWRFAQVVAGTSYREVGWFVTSRIVDGSWLAGGRALFRGDSALPPRHWLGKATREHGSLADPALLVFPAFVSLFLFGPLLLGRPREWLRFLAQGMRGLSLFSYLLAFALLDATVSVFLYPTQLRYALVRWWFVPQELILVVSMATLVATAGAFVGRRILDSAWRHRVLCALLALGVCTSVWSFVHTFWRGEVIQYDWKLSWGDESYRAARWLGENLPPGAVVGSWNAGVLGYYAPRRVVNLDGLINSPDFLAVLEEGALSEYIRREGIDYLSDMEGRIQMAGVDRALDLSEIYRHRSALTGGDYLIYRVE